MTILEFIKKVDSFRRAGKSVREFYERSANTKRSCDNATIVGRVIIESARIVPNNGEK